MELEELRALVWDILGIHATADKVDTIILAAQAHAALLAERQAVLLEAAAATQEAR